MSLHDLLIAGLAHHARRDDSSVRKKFDARKNNIALITRKKYTPIMVQIVSRQPIEAVREAIEAGAATIDARDYKSRTAIWLAACNGYIDAVMDLWRAGATLYDPSWLDGVGVIHLLSSAGATEQLREIFDSMDADTVRTHLNTFTHDGHDPVQYALARNTWDIPSVVQLAIAHGYNVNSVGAKGWTTLMRACMNGSAAAVRILLDAGADPNAVKGDGYNALMLTVNNHHVECARMLVAAGADPNQCKPSQTKVTALSKSRKTASRAHARSADRVILAILESAATETAPETAATETTSDGTSDSGTGDSGTGDSGTGDSGTSDSGTSDSGTSDSGTSDSGTGDSAN